MKKLFTIIALLLAFTFTFGLMVNASELSTTDEVGELPNAGVKPGDFLYTFDRFFEKVSIAFTFSDEKKAEKLASIAEERLAELNALDSEAASRYADQLFSDYGLDIEKANLYVQQLVAEGKISEERLAKLEEKVQRAELKQEKVKAANRNKVSEEIKTKVSEEIKKAKMSIFSRFNDLETIQALHEEGYGYGQLLKLQAIADLASSSINDLLLIENAVTVDENGEKEVNFDVIYQSTGLTQQQLREKLAEYRLIAKENMKGQLNNAEKRATGRK